jgi:hypothetical protein
MIRVLRIELEFPLMVSKDVDIKTDKTPDQFKEEISKKYEELGVPVNIQLQYKETD